MQIPTPAQVAALATARRQQHQAQIRRLLLEPERLARLARLRQLGAADRERTERQERDRQARLARLRALHAGDPAPRYMTYEQALQTLSGEQQRAFETLFAPGVHRRGGGQIINVA